MGEEMNYLKAVEYYTEMGMSEEEACHAASCDFLDEYNPEDEEDD